MSQKLTVYALYHDRTGGGRDLVGLFASQRSLFDHACGELGLVPKPPVLAPKYGWDGDWWLPAHHWGPIEVQP